MLLLQAVGEGKAGVAFSRHEDTSMTTSITLSRILFQLSSTAVFSVLLVYIALFRGARTLARNKPMLLPFEAIMVTVTTSWVFADRRVGIRMEGHVGYNRQIPIRA